MISLKERLINISGIKSGDRLSYLFSAAVIGVLAFTFIITFYNIGERSFRSGDEARYAIIAHNVLTAENPLILQLNGRAYFNKPPLNFWLMALFAKIFGESEISLRLPSLIFGLFCFGMLFLWGLKFNRWVALISPLVVLSTAQFVAHRGLRRAVLETSSIFFILLAFYLIACLRNCRFGAFLAGVAVGLGVMSKSFIPFFIPGAILLETLIYSPKEARGTRYKEIAIMTATSILVIAPWHIYMIWLYGKTFVSQYFFAQQLSRVWEQVSVEYSPFSYLLLSLGWFPWTILFAIGAYGVLRRGAERPAEEMRGVLIYLLGYLALINVAESKAPRYIYPLYLLGAPVVGYGFWLLAARKAEFSRFKARAVAVLRVAAYYAIISGLISALPAISIEKQSLLSSISSQAEGDIYFVNAEKHLTDETADDSYYWMSLKERLKDKTYSLEGILEKRGGLPDGVALFLAEDFCRIRPYLSPGERVYLSRNAVSEFGAVFRRSGVAPPNYFSYIELKGGEEVGYHSGKHLSGFDLISAKLNREGFTFYSELRWLAKGGGTKGGEKESNTSLRLKAGAKDIYITANRIHPPDRLIERFTCIETGDVVVHFDEHFFIKPFSGEVEIALSFPGEGGGEDLPLGRVTSGSWFFPLLVGAPTALHMYLLNKCKVSL
ncbi:MAG: hypothetical protein Kow0090_14440 [Myxococcota bacterium]